MTFIIFEKSNEILPVFESGTKLKCLRNIEFIDGSCHFEGLVYKVTDSNSAYFSVANKFYAIVNE